MRNFTALIIYPIKIGLCFITLLMFTNILFSQTPVASYPFNGNADDVSGNGNNGILTGTTSKPVLTADRFGNPNSAYEFGGYFNKNWIRIPNSSSLKLGNQLSISLWFNQCSFAGMDGWGQFVPNGFHILVSKAGDGISVNPGFDAGIYTDTNNLLTLTFRNTNGRGRIPPNFDAYCYINCFDTCEWIHFVVVADNDKLQMYFNGRKTLDQTITPADFTNANTQDLYIGSMDGGSWYPFKGKIDDVNIYNVALTQEQVIKLTGTYRSPLAVNNTITLDSLVTYMACGTSGKGAISIFPNIDNAPYQFSVDNGTTYQSTGIFTNLPVGDYKVRVKTKCNQKDTLITIGTSYQITKTLTICQGKSFLGHTSSGTYVDKFITSKGCDSLITTILTVNPTPGANFEVSPEEVSIVKPDVTFTDKSASTIPVTWLWRLGNGETSMSQSFNYVYSDTGKFVVTLVVKNQYGCTDSISKRVIVRPGYSIFIPNAFTPNGDGYNDTFGPVTLGIRSLEMNISDRNGRLIHKIDRVDGKWDGMMPSGQSAPQGVYYYLLRAMGYENIEYIRQGNVNLYRDYIKLVPNPVNFSAVLNFTGTLSGEKIISVYKSSGVLIRMFNTSDDIVYFDLSSLSKGLYFIRATDSLQTTEVKFIKE